MLISTRGRYALRVLVDLAEQNTSEYIPLKEIAARQHISQKYSEPIRISEIAKHCGLDRSYLSKLFKNATDMTPQEYLLSFRMNKAKELLKDSSISVQNVAYSVGYNDPFSFSKFFKRETGLSPSEYRKKNL